ncbi:MAG: DUF4287 domain-containing protein [Blastocatellia bacterium]|nr:DUF4287 domain-containing protein [Blastocatellia bacterium]
MSDVNKAIETQLKNIQTKTGKTLDDLMSIIKQSGLAKHGEIRDMLKKDLTLGHGDANTLTHLFLKPAENETKDNSSTDILNEIYAGTKASLRPIHEKLMEAINEFGTFEIAPKKGYVSLRRKKQFAMITPATNSRVEVGINLKSLQATDRLAEMPANSMCHFKVKLTTVDEVDSELINWIKQAYEAAE